MHQSSTLVLTLAFAALLSNAALFPKGSNVQQIDHKAFRKALKQDTSFLTAFVAPWCGHCQKLAPELVRVADGFHPLVPVYAVDCDEDKNKPLCAEQGVKGFPTVKLYPRGSREPSLEFDGTRTASSIFYWASRAVPGSIFRTVTHEGLSEWVSKNAGKPKAVLLNKSNKLPLLWRVLSNKFENKVVFANCRDLRGKVSVQLGYEVEEKSKSKVLIYGPDGTGPIRYEGLMKFAALSKFLDQVLDGTVDTRGRASADTKQKVLKAPENDNNGPDDESRIGEAGWAGFNPHEGLDLEEFIKRGMNPHGAGHPGAPNAKQDQSLKDEVTSASNTGSSTVAAQSTEALPKSDATTVPEEPSESRAKEEL